MKELTGTGVYPGIAVGKVKVIAHEQQKVLTVSQSTKKTESERLEEAISRSEKELKELYAQTLQLAGEKEASIFEGYRMLLQDDEGLVGKMKELLTQGKDAGTAVSETKRQYMELFSNMEDSYMCARADDIRNVCDRVLFALSGKTRAEEEYMEPVIIVADELMPGEVIGFERDKVVAFVTRKGTILSHVSILARSLKIPYLICPYMEDLSSMDGRMAMVDAFGDLVVIEPTEEMIKQAFSGKERTDDVAACDKDVIPVDSSAANLEGCNKIRITCNRQVPEDVEQILEVKADGVGLFRSEFLFLGRDSAPSEAEQFEAYKKVLTAMSDTRVVIRTMDVGADKTEEYLQIPQLTEDGKKCRGIRFSLSRRDLFETQIRAVLRASVYGNPAVMFPMVENPKEVQSAIEIINQVAESLDQAGVEYRIPPIGVMIETVEAVEQSGVLAQKVDFFSIGTNDLTQAVMGIDRADGMITSYNKEEIQKEVLPYIKKVTEYAIKEQIPVEICGELAADINCTEAFLQIGITELSVAPSMVMEIRKKVQELLS